MSPGRDVRLLFLLSALALGAAACAPFTERASAETAPSTTFAPIERLDAVATTSTTAATTTTAPTTTATTFPPPVEQQRGRLIISGTGDVNLDPAFVRNFPETGYEYAWTGMKGLFTGDDLTVVNLECSPSPNGVPWNKPWVFGCDPAAYPSMRAAGVEVANLANNHGIDLGFDAMLEGRGFLMDNDIVPVGAGANAEEAYAAAIFEISGWTIAVLGGGGVGPETGSWTAGDNRPGITNGDSIEAMTAAIRAADEIADIVIVTIHWGNQGETTPAAADVRRGHAYIEAGADAIFGHHPHVLQPMTWHEGRPIVWSLGNFVWQAYPPESKKTAVAQVVFEPDGRIGACLIPVVIEETGHPVLQPGYDGPCIPDGPR